MPEYALVTCHSSDFIMFIVYTILDIERHFADAKMYWSWPIFLSASGLTFGISLLQR